MTTVYFDFACEPTYRFFRWLELAEVEADWRPFSTFRAEQSEADKPVWDMSTEVPESVLALAGHEFVLAQGGPGSKAYREEMFRLFHAEAEQPTRERIWRVIEKYTGHAKDELDLEAAIDRVRQSHELAASKRVEASPTVFIGTSDKPYFVRLEAVPETARAAKALWNGLPRCAHHFPDPVTIEAVD